MNYTEMIEGSQQKQTPLMPPAIPQFSAMMNPQNEVANQLARPAASPQEAEARKAGWLSVIDRVQNNPNLLRALGYAGAALAQPRPMGQTNLGHLANAYIVGQSAYDAGNAAQFEQGMKVSKEQREQAESKATVEQKGAQTEQTRVATDTARQTQDAVIAQTKTAAEQAAFNLKKAQSEEEITAVERELRKQKAEIEKSIPDEARRKAALGQLEAASLAAEEARANIAARRASAGASSAAAAASRAHGQFYSAQAAEHQQRADLIKNMDEVEKKEFLTKTGRYAGSTSALTQHRDMWGGLYDKLPADDPAKKGKTKEQFVMQRLSETKQKDAIELLVKAKQAGLTDDEIDKLGLLDLAASSAAARRAPGAAAPASGVTKMVWDAKLNKYVPEKNVVEGKIKQ